MLLRARGGFSGPVALRGEEREHEVGGGTGNTKDTLGQSEGGQSGDEVEAGGEEERRWQRLGTATKKERGGREMKEEDK